ncbi:hypothetical protein EAF04_004090 [Stromatinia cepivora]|nr:hypothetical protein EAF04_004090 [Stromatinia cepivora]
MSKSEKKTVWRSRDKKDFHDFARSRGYGDQTDSRGGREKSRVRARSTKPRSNSKARTTHDSSDPSRDAEILYCSRRRGDDRTSREDVEVDRKRDPERRQRKEDPEERRRKEERRRREENDREEKRLKQEYLKKKSREKKKVEHERIRAQEKYTKGARKSDRGIRDVDRDRDRRERSRISERQIRYEQNPFTPVPNYGSGNNADQYRRSRSNTLNPNTYPSSADPRLTPGGYYDPRRRD